jgi:GNAT superfamily N-acetyltransferase
MRFCDINDAKELSEMALEIWTEYYSTFLDTDLPNYVVRTFQSEEAIREQIGKGYLYSFIMNGDIKAGYLCILPEGDSLFMSKYYLKKECRGKGIGSKAMDEILKKGREMKKKRVYLRVNRFNPSIEIYKHKGFVVIEEKKEDLGNGLFLDDFVMEYRY